MKVYRALGGWRVETLEGVFPSRDAARAARTQLWRGQRIAQEKIAFQEGLAASQARGLERFRAWTSFEVPGKASGHCPFEVEADPKVARAFVEFLHYANDGRTGVHEDDLRRLGVL